MANVGVRPRAVAAAVATLLVAAPALAQPLGPTPPAKPATEAQKRQAGELVKKAITKSQANDHEGAIALYLDAYKVVPSALLLSNVGTEYQQDGKLVEALKYFCMYLQEDPTGTNASYATAQAKVVQVELGHPVPDDAQVCAPAADVTPPPDVVPPPVVEPPLVVPPGPPPGRDLKLAGLGTGAAGVVAIGIGVVFGLKAKAISDEISDHCAGQDPCPEWPANIKEREAAGQRDENIQVATLIVGSSLLAVGAIVYLVGRTKANQAQESRLQTSMRLVPSASPTTVGLGLVGRF